MSFRNQPASPDKPIVICAAGHKLRQREWTLHEFCFEGPCMHRETCEVAKRQPDFAQKVRESLE